MRSIGEFLRDKRIEKGIGDEYFRKGYTLNMRIVKALESDDYAFFKGYFYFINFLKDYLKMVGVDIEEFKAEYKEELEFIKENSFKAGIYFPGMRYSKFKKKSVFLQVVLLLFILFLFFLYVNRESLYRNFSDWQGVKSLKIPETFYGYFGDRVVDNDFSLINLSLNFTENCWIRVMRGDEIVSEKVFHKDETYEINGYDITLIIGNPTVVEINVNGNMIEKFRNRTSFTKIRLNPDTLENILK